MEVSRGTKLRELQTVSNEPPRNSDELAFEAPCLGVKLRTPPEMGNVNPTSAAKTGIRSRPIVL